MKTNQLTKSSKFSFLSRRTGGRFVTVFAAALALGMSVQSLLAQGPYYPTFSPAGNSATNTGFVNGSGPFTGASFTTSLSYAGALNLIESSLPVGKSIIVPTPSGKTAASAAEYTAALKAAATANVGTPQTIKDLATVAVVFDTYGISSALSGLAEGITASGASTADKLSRLADAAGAAGASSPGGVTSSNYSGFLLKVAQFTNLTPATSGTELGKITKNIFTGAAGTSLGASALDSSQINSIASSVYGALLAANAATVKINTENAAVEIIQAIATPGSALNSAINIDRAANGFTTNAPSATTVQGMVAKLHTGIAAANGGSLTDLQAGSIALGVLRNGSVWGSAGILSALKNELQTNPNAAPGDYAVDIVESFDYFRLNPGNTAALNVTGLTGVRDAAALAAATSLRFPGNASAVVQQVLAAPASLNISNSVDRINVVAGTVQAVQGSAVAIATALAAGVSNPGGNTTPDEVVKGAIRGAKLSSAGQIARAVVINPANINSPGAVASAAITAANSVSPGNAADAYADIAYNVAFGIKLSGVVGDARTSAATTAMVAAAGAADKFIPVVAAIAGASVNAAAIQAAGLFAAPAQTAAINSGATLANLLNGGATFRPTDAYARLMDRVQAVGTGDLATNRANLYAYSLANSSDAVAGLAVMLGKTTGSDALLLKDAISANRSKQANLTVASTVATYFRDQIALPGGVSNLNIQEYLGNQIVANSSTLTSDIAVAAIAVAPSQSHVIAHTVAFNAPQQVAGVAESMIYHSKFSSTNVAGVGGQDKLALGDRPAALAALTAGFVTGIVESQITATYTQALKSNALKTTVQKIVQAVILNPTATNNYDGPTYVRSNGAAPGTTVVASRGVAGVVTGFVAQVAVPGSYNNTAIGSDLYTTLATIKATAPSIYLIDIAQAAAQAYAWVTAGQNDQAPLGGGAVAAANLALGTATTPGTPAYNIAAALGASADVNGAVNFGVSQALTAVVPGVGASGLRQTAALPFYSHHSAQGLPVSNIFSL